MVWIVWANGALLDQGLSKRPLLDHHLHDHHNAHLSFHSLLDQSDLYDECNYSVGVS